MTQRAQKMKQGYDGWMLAVNIQVLLKINVHLSSACVCVSHSHSFASPS